jgi:hypothetical protein
LLNLSPLISAYGNPVPYPLPCSTSDMGVVSCAILSHNTAGTQPWHDRRSEAPISLRPDKIDPAIGDQLAEVDQTRRAANPVDG